MSTGAVAAFPIIERLEKIGGRVRCAACGFGVGSVLCLLFCLISFGDDYFRKVPIIADFDTIMEVEDSGTATMNRRYLFLSEQHNITIQRQLQSRHQVALHVCTAVAFQAVLCFLEPSLKSILSLHVNLRPFFSPKSSSTRGSSLGLGMGLMSTLGNTGGILGNLAGTWMYKLSKDTTPLIRGQRNDMFLKDGSLPFVFIAGLMAISSILVWRLEEPIATTTEGIDKETALVREEVEPKHSVGNEGSVIEESTEDSEESRQDRCCLLLRETTYDLKLD